MFLYRSRFSGSEAAGSPCGQRLAVDAWSRRGQTSDRLPQQLLEQTIAVAVAWQMVSLLGTVGRDFLARHRNCIPAAGNLIAEARTLIAK